ncbi:hypothetical protein [Acetobacterium woodii]|uniref:Uncharacterized protein n=1 Tax=Acetobacterium woodii (strain ATCC 29683 / DSM 1030 / JCM 2381 / KCTC 1655 / WB1) TaxID=931626 RepID=H6LKS3_ACEWD|nr:hypothetical protein [Acetobacterium woodii]AFA48865.1 hypothetical protein Awo_c20890 [Acetobacterium woodii DSM 1030]
MSEQKNKVENTKKDNDDYPRYKVNDQFIEQMTAGDDELQTTGFKISKPVKKSLRWLTERMLLKQFAPAAVVVDALGQIQFIHGQTGVFLEPVPGYHGTSNILKMSRVGIRRKLTVALNEAVTLQKIVYSPDLKVKTIGGYVLVNLTVGPLENHKEEPALFIVIFENASNKIKLQQNVIESQRYPIFLDEKTNLQVQMDAEQELLKIENTLNSKYVELATIKSELQTNNEIYEMLQIELQKTNGKLDVTKSDLEMNDQLVEIAQENLQTINEKLITNRTELQNNSELLQKYKNELVSVNEQLAQNKTELQKTNELLETAKEELQTINKKLSEDKTELQNNIMLLETSKEELQRVGKKLIQDRAELCSNDERLAKANEELQQITEKISRTRVEMQNMDEKLTRVQTELQNNDDQLYTATAELEKVNEELQQKQTELQNNDLRLEKSNEELQKITKKLIKDQMELQSNDERLKRSKTELHEIDEKLSRDRTELQNNDGQLKKSKAELHEIDKKLSQGRKELQNNDELLVIAKEELQNVNEKLITSKNELRINNNLLELSKDELLTVNIELDNQKTELEKGNKLPELLKQKLETIKNELDTMKNELQTTSQELYNANEKLSKTNEEIENSRKILNSQKTEISMNESKYSKNKENTVHEKVHSLYSDEKPVIENIHSLFNNEKSPDSKGQSPVISEKSDVNETQFLGKSIELPGTNTVQFHFREKSEIDLPSNNEFADSNDLIIPESSQVSSEKNLFKFVPAEDEINFKESNISDMNRFTPDFLDEKSNKSSLVTLDTIASESSEFDEVKKEFQTMNLKEWFLLLAKIEEDGAELYEKFSEVCSEKLKAVVRSFAQEEFKHKRLMIDLASDDQYKNIHLDKMVSDISLQQADYVANNCGSVNSPSDKEFLQFALELEKNYIEIYKRQLTIFTADSSEYKKFKSIIEEARKHMIFILNKLNDMKQAEFSEQIMTMRKVGVQYKD